MARIHTFDRVAVFIHVVDVLAHQSTGDCVDFLFPVFVKCLAVLRVHLAKSLASA
ncbi:MAG: hypothetical protein ACD_23C00185G0001 [uncultured bacterium]|nr:MAG: hypothetical protein ACD_23C00185G0001 [uncultured bacterium]